MVMDIYSRAYKILKRCTKVDNEVPTQSTANAVLSALCQEDKECDAALPMETEEQEENVPQQQSNCDSNPLMLKGNVERRMHSSLHSEKSRCKEAVQLNSAEIKEKPAVNIANIKSRDPCTCKSTLHSRGSKVAHSVNSKGKQNALQKLPNATHGQEIITDKPSTESDISPADINTYETRSTNISMLMTTHASPFVGNRILDAGSSGSSGVLNCESLSVADQIQTAEEVITESLQTLKTDNAKTMQKLSQFMEFADQLKKSESTILSLSNETQAMRNTGKFMPNIPMLTSQPVSCMANMQNVEQLCSTEPNETQTMGNIEKLMPNSSMLNSQPVLCMANVQNVKQLYSTELNEAQTMENIEKLQPNRPMLFTNHQVSYLANVQNVEQLCSAEPNETQTTENIEKLQPNSSMLLTNHPYSCLSNMQNVEQLYSAECNETQTTENIEKLLPNRPILLTNHPVSCLANVQNVEQLYSAECNETQTTENIEKLLPNRPILLTNHPVSCLANVQNVEQLCSAEPNETQTTENIEKLQPNSSMLLTNHPYSCLSNMQNVEQLYSAECNETQTTENIEKLLPNRPILLTNHPVSCLANVQNVEQLCSAEPNETQTTENIEKSLPNRPMLLTNHPVSCLANVQNVEQLCTTEPNETCRIAFPINVFNSKINETFVLILPERQVKFTPAVMSQMELLTSADQNQAYELLTIRNVETQAVAEENLNANESLIIASDTNTGLQTMAAENSVPVKHLKVQFLEKNRQGDAKETEVKKKQSSADNLQISKGLTLTDKSCVPSSGIGIQNIGLETLLLGKQERHSNMVGGATETEVVKDVSSEVHSQSSSTRSPNIALQNLEEGVTSQAEKSQTMVSISPVTLGMPNTELQMERAEMHTLEGGFSSHEEERQALPPHSFPILEALLSQNSEREQTFLLEQEAQVFENNNLQHSIGTDISPISAEALTTEKCIPSNKDESQIMVSQEPLSLQHYIGTETKNISPISAEALATEKCVPSNKDGQIMVSQDPPFSASPRMALPGEEAEEEEEEEEEEEAEEEEEEEDLDLFICEPCGSQYNDSFEMDEHLSECHKELKVHRMHVEDEHTFIFRPEES